MRTMTMPKHPGGRPKKGQEPAGSRQVRVMSDLADMIGEIVEVRGKGWSSVRLLDPLIRGEITALHAQLLPQIEKLRAIRKQAQTEE
jgi:hypothetical protein